MLPEREKFVLTKFVVCAIADHPRHAARLVKIRFHSGQSNTLPRLLQESQWHFIHYLGPTNRRAIGPWLNVPQPQVFDIVFGLCPVCRASMLLAHGRILALADTRGNLTTTFHIDLDFIKTPRTPADEWPTIERTDTA